jgi:translation initiation factor IF-3
LKILQRVTEDVADFATVESSPRQDGRNMTMVLNPIRKQNSKSRTAKTNSAKTNSAKTKPPKAEASKAEAPTAEAATTEAPTTEAPTPEAVATATDSAGAQ